MKVHTQSLSLISIVTTVILSGCQSTTQTTSGRDYLNKYPTTSIGSSNSSKAQTLDEEIAEIAAVEPLLRFPARIGLAKVYNGQISNLTEAEAAAWTEARTQLGSDFGEFIPVSSLIAEMVYTSSGQNQRNQASEIVRKIRMGAARQHLDAVFIYEVFSETSERTLPSAVANWTIIGAYFVPSEESTTVGYANALLFDVRNGYTYGTASATATEKDLTTLVAQYDQKQRQQNAAQVAASVNLVDESVELFKKLRKELK